MTSPQQQPQQALFFAVQQGDLAAASAALAAGADPNAAGPSGGETPLMQIRLGRDRERMLRLLLDHGGDPNRTDLADRNALHHLAMTGDPDLVDLLLGKGADASARDCFGLRPFDVALTHASDIRTLRLLVAALSGADREDRTRLFVWYLRHGRADDAIALIDEGIALDGLGPQAMPMLYGAAVAGAVRVVDALLAAGAAVDASFGAGETALHAAARGGHAAVVARLLAAGAAVDHRDRQGGSALHATARAIDARDDALIEVAAHLLRAGADPTLRDQYGYWPRAAARAAGRARLAEFLPAAAFEPPIDPAHAAIAVVQLGTVGEARLRWRPNDLLRPFAIEEHLGRGEWAGRDLTAEELPRLAAGLLRQPELAWCAPLLRDAGTLTLAALQARSPRRLATERFRARNG